MRQPVTTIDIRRDLVGLLPRLRRFAMTLAGDVRADELVQVACQRAIAKSSQWQGEGRLDSWVYTLMRQQQWAGGSPQAQAARRQQDQRHRHSHGQYATAPPPSILTRSTG